MVIPIYRKKHKVSKIKGLNRFLNKVVFGFYGIRSLEAGILLVKHLEMIRLLVSRISKRVSKVFIRIFFLQPMTKRPLKSRMGKGIGVIKL
jgi:large subunit ribosomal protein L16